MRRFCGVKRMVADENWSLRMGCGAVRSVRIQELGYGLLVFFGNRLAIYIPSTKEDTHKFSRFGTLALAAIQNAVQFRQIRFVVDDLAIDFDPGMGLEWKFLGADHHLRRNSTASQQAHG